jgi:xanthosine utilization system XapX-like protein
MAQEAPAMRPMGVSDLFDETTRLYRRHFGQLVAIAAFMQAPSLLFLLLAGGLGMTGALASTAGQEPSPTLIFGLLGVMAVAFLVALLTVPVGISAMVWAVSEARFGRRLGVGEAIRRGFHRYWSVIGLATVYTIAVGAMWLTVIGIPFGIYFSVAWGVCYACLLLEGTGVFASLSRSRALVRGLWWRTFGIALLFLIFQSVIAWIISFPFGMVVGLVGTLLQTDAAVQPALAIVNVLGQVIAQVLPLPILYIGWVLYYYDLRIRKEGLDLAMRAEQLAPPVLTQEPGPAM